MTARRLMIAPPKKDKGSIVLVVGDSRVRDRRHRLDHVQLSAVVAFHLTR
jgi:hypothetical protein